MLFFKLLHEFTLIFRQTLLIIHNINILLHFDGFCEISLSTYELFHKAPIPTHKIKRMYLCFGWSKDPEEEL